MGYQAKNFRLDASADTLILEDDQALRATRETANRYGEQDFVVVTYSPKEDLFSPLPLFCCFFSTLAMAGFLGLFGWEVTVISSNFISLQLIITMAMTIHLIVRYRELGEAFPDAENKELILLTVSSMFKPCLYAALTTIAGFASLVLSNILPVINFGWMMIAGITVSLILTFLIFPIVLIFLDKTVSDSSRKPAFPLATIFARFTACNGKLIMMVSTQSRSCSALLALHGLPWKTALSTISNIRPKSTKA